MSNDNAPIENSTIQQRLDLALVSRGLMDTRAQGQAAIKAGKVTINGEVCKKASTKVSPDQDIQAEKEHPYVSRGGLKLAHAINVFDVKFAGKTVLDVGASTGGFTDVAIRSGANKVFAVDVGRDQLHISLQKDERIVSYEGMDARKLDARLINIPPDIIVCDASFISLSKLLKTALNLAADRAELIALFKPQFEVGKENIGKGGIVSNQGAVVKARERFDDWLESVGWRVEKSSPSPIRGGDGNREYLIHAKPIKQGWTP